MSRPETWRTLLSKLDPGYATVGQPRSILGIPFRVDTVRGPWFSLGIHLDFQRPCIDIHFVWWIIIIGKSYEYEAVEVDTYPFGDSNTDYHILTTTSARNSPAVPAIEIEPATMWGEQWETIKAEPYGRSND